MFEPSPLLWVVMLGEAMETSGGTPYRKWWAAGPNQRQKSGLTQNRASLGERRVKKGWVWCSKRQPKDQGHLSHTATTSTATATKGSAPKQGPVSVHSSPLCAAWNWPTSAGMVCPPNDRLAVKGKPVFPTLSGKGEDEEENAPYPGLPSPQPTEPWARLGALSSTRSPALKAIPSPHLLLEDSPEQYRNKLTHFHPPLPAPAWPLLQAWYPKGRACPQRLAGRCTNAVAIRVPTARDFPQATDITDLNLGTRRGPKGNRAVEGTCSREPLAVARFPGLADLLGRSGAVEKLQSNEGRLWEASVQTAL